jgi:hypothetical protein
MVLFVTVVKPCLIVYFVVVDVVVISALEGGTVPTIEIVASLSLLA